MEPTTPIPPDQRRFVMVDLGGARFQNVNLSDAVVRGAFLHRVELHGDVHRLTVNGVDVTEYVERTLDERDPLRVRIRSDDADDLRAGWDELESRWAATTDRVRALGPAAATSSVDEEWTYSQTLRHLVYATDCWLRRAVLGRTDDAFHPWGLPFSEADAGELEATGIDAHADPTFEEVLAMRADRQGQVRAFLADVTEEQLAQPCPPNPVSAHPFDPPRIPVGEAVKVILNEELWHHAYAVRDLDHLEADDA